MAKPFYSIEEVCERLGQDEEGVRALVRDGKLREFRDAGKVFFKSEDVDKIASPSEGSGSGEITLGAADEELPSLADHSSGTSMLGLEPLGDDDAPAEKKKKEDTVISASGIGVFDDDELEIDADPMAKTQITEAATSDQVSLEGSGSGSGLLDLTRESDDTSLGAELLDEIYPGEDEAAPVEQAAPAEAPVDQASDDTQEEPETSATEEAAAPAAMPVAAVAALAVSADPMEGLFSGLLAGIVILLAVAGSVVAGVLQGFLPDYARFLSNRFWFLLGGAALVPILTLLIGWVIGRASTPRRS